MSKISSIHRRFVFRLRTWQPKYFVNPFYSPSLDYYWHATQLDIDLVLNGKPETGGGFRRLLGLANNTRGGNGQ